MANLEQSESRILNVWYVTFKFLLIVIFKINNLKHSPHTVALSEGTFSAKNADYVQKQKKKNVGISKIEGGPVTKRDIFSRTTHVCVITYQISSF